jgi:Na+:H+ antiporter
MGHADPITPLLLSLAIILITGKIGVDLAARIGQPGVLGELVVGVVLGNLGLLGFHGLEFMKESDAISLLAGLGVLVLLFEVGLESTVAQMMKVGPSAFLVAVTGVVVPSLLGWGVGAWLLPDASIFVHFFLGATLCATSVGITARVLQDLGRSKDRESRIILGAAVVDDVLGLVVLAVVAGAIAAADRGTGISLGATVMILAKATLFLVGSLVLGVKLSPRLFHFASGSRAKGVLLALGLSFCFFLSWLANLVGLAPIVGAFAAGLILEDLHYRNFKERGEQGLEELIHPISAFLAPIFFVLMGMRTDLRSFAQSGVLGLAAVLTLAAIGGKLVCGLAALEKRLDRLSIGIGMVPRGEVGLIFANMGLGLAIAGERIITASTYSAIVVMVILTTLVTPPALKWSLFRSSSRTASR